MSELQDEWRKQTTRFEILESCKHKAAHPPAIPMHRDTDFITLQICRS